MGTRLFVGNLSYTTTEDALREVFAADGRGVVRVRVMLDRETGRPRGFAFVDMASEVDAEAAVRALDGARVDGRAMRVDIASEREPVRGGGERPGPRPERSAEGRAPTAARDADRESGTAGERVARPAAEGSASTREPRRFGPDRAPWRNDDRRRGGERKRGERGDDRGPRRGRRPSTDDDDDDDDWS